MSESYLSIPAPSEGRYEEKKSVFLAFAAPIQSEEEAIQFVGGVKKKYPDARHHVYAYVLREGNKSRYTDDGEPSGTAGMPVLDGIRKRGLTDVAVVVVRYFGGTLLGTGGLVRAYTAAAKDALDKAGTVLWQEMTNLLLRVTYQDYQRVSQLPEGVRETGTAFGDTVELTVSMPSERTDGFEKWVTERTCGRAEIQFLSKGMNF
ncbi:MAG: YigZ family protein [Clostridia bacterium]|nr:YigZ family protein [Clostridia bacterium]